MKLLLNYIATPGVMNKKGIRAQIGICGFSRSKVNAGNLDDVYIGGIPIAWPSGKSPMVATSSYAGVGVKSVLRGAYMDILLLLKRLVAVILFGNDGSGVGASLRNCNSISVENARSVKSVNNERRFNSLL